MCACTQFLNSAFKNALIPLEMLSLLSIHCRKGIALRQIKVNDLHNQFKSQLKNLSDILYLKTFEKKEGSYLNY